MINDQKTNQHNHSGQRYYKPRCGEWPRSGGTIYIEHRSSLGIEVLPSSQLSAISMATRVFAGSSEFENTEMLEDLRETSALSLFRLYIAYTK